MKIEDYLTTLPESILSGEDVQLPKQAFREIFKFANLRNDDVFYHLGCGDGTGLVIAKEEFNAVKIIGIDISKEKTDAASKLVKEKNYSNIKIINEDIVNSHFDDADVILFWFVDDSILEKIMPKFSRLTFTAVNPVNSNITQHPYYDHYGVAFGNNTFVVVGASGSGTDWTDPGSIARSTDNGSTFSAVTPADSTVLYGVTF